jgi:hypothetical protein
LPIMAPDHKYIYCVLCGLWLLPENRGEPAECMAELGQFVADFRHGFGSAVILSEAKGPRS